jgi:hypothetical protein
LTIRFYANYDGAFEAGSTELVVAGTTGGTVDVSIGVTLSVDIVWSSDTALNDVGSAGVIGRAAVETGGAFVDGTTGGSIVTGGGNGSFALTAFGDLVLANFLEFELAPAVFIDNLGVPVAERFSETMDPPVCISI